MKSYKLYNRFSSQYKTNGTELRGAPLTIPGNEIAYSKPLFDENDAMITIEELEFAGIYTKDMKNYNTDTSYIRDNSKGTSNWMTLSTFGNGHSIP